MDNKKTRITLFDLLLPPVKRWKLVVICTAGVTALMLLVNLLCMVLPASSPLNVLPDTYRPEVTVRLNSPSESSGLSSMVPSSLSSMLGSFGQAVNPNLSLVQELAKSNKILDTLGQEFGFQKRFRDAPVTNTRLFLTKKLKLTVGADAASSGMVFVVISFEDTDKDLATRVLKRAIELIESEFRRVTLEPVTSKREFLEDREKVVSAEFAKAEATLTDFQKRYGMDLKTQAVNQAQAIAQLQQDIYAAELKIKASYLGEDDPLVKQMRDQIRQKQKLIEEIKSGAAGSGFSASPAVPLDAVPGLMSEYANLQLEVQGQTELYTMIRKELESAKIEEAGNAAIFQIINPLETPEAKFYPKRSQVMVISALIGLFLGLFLAYVLEFLEKRKNDPVEGRKLDEIRAFIPFRRKKRV
jgi:tyrosine-protein kinase Etk/Wzc